VSSFESWITSNIGPSGGMTGASISGPYQLARDESKPFTASPIGGTAPYPYFWSMRFYSPMYGWGAWSTPYEGSATTYASSSSCGYSQFELRVEIRSGGCSVRTTHRVDITNWQC
jgi:hypothetical protein